MVIHAGRAREQAKRDGGKRKGNILAGDRQDVFLPDGPSAPSKSGAPRLY